MFKGILIVSLLIGTSYCFPTSTRVVNGTAAEVGQYPYIVSLRGSTGSHSCGASIISNTYILTAAHCVNGKQPSAISIQYGVTTIAASGPNVAAVKKIIVHSKYAPSNNYANDIALLQLQGRLVFNANTVSAMRLPTQGFEVPDAAQGTLIGWGLEKTGGSVQKNLQQVGLKIYSDEECNQRHDGRTTGDQICGGVDEGGKGQCSGDSGGPLIYEGVQVGIVSWSIKPCTVAPYPGVYTKVSHYIDWIQENAVE